MNDLEILTLEAFLAALAKQSAPLPNEIQQRLQAIGENLEQHVDDLDALAETYPPLDVAYQSERLALQRQGGQRQKFLNAPNGNDVEVLPRVAKAIFRSADSVLTTQDFVRPAKDHPELVLISSNGSPDNEGLKTASATPATDAFPTNAAINSPPAQSTPLGIQRIVLAANASDRDQQNYQQYLEELKRLNLRMGTYTGSSATR